MRGPSHAETHQFVVTDERELVIDFHSAVEEQGAIAGVVTHEGAPVARARVQGVSADEASNGDFNAATGEDGRFQAQRWRDAMAVSAWTEDGKLRGLATITREQEEVSIPLLPTATAVGRLVDGKTGAPLLERDVHWGIRVHAGGLNAPFRYSFGGRTATDERGRFELTGLAADQSYDVYVWREYGLQLATVAVVRPAAGERIDLGDAILEPPAAPPTREERAADAFAAPADVETRLAVALRDARLAKQQVLLCFADPESPAAVELHEANYDGLLNAMADYRVLYLDRQGDAQREETAALAARLGISFTDDAPLLVVLDPEGREQATASLGEYRKEDRLDVPALAAWLHEQAPARPDAEELLNDALAAARREGKRVWLQQTGAYCGPCYRLSRFLDDQRDVLSPHLVQVKIDDYRFPGGKELIERLRADRTGGIPWMAVLDEEGKVLVTSDGPEGNIGFPSAASEIDHFLTMLRTSLPNLSDEDLARLRDALQK